MSYRNYACYSDTVLAEFVKKMCPKEFEDLMNIIDKYDVSLISLSQAVEMDDFDGELSCSCDLEDGQAEEILSVWEALVIKFKEATGGLDLSLIYHDSDAEGDDLEDGYSWAVYDVYQYTPAGEKYKKDITRKTWVVGG